MEIPQSICTRDKVVHSRVNHNKLLFGNWSILTLRGKELELVEEAKWYYLDIVRVSLSKRRGSGTVNLDGGSSSVLELNQGCQHKGVCEYSRAPSCQTVFQIGFKLISHYI